MNKSLLLAGVAASLMLAAAAPVAAQTVTPGNEVVTTGRASAKPAPAAPTEETFTTGVAKGRDRLDSATSTSALKESDIQEFGAHSLAEVIRNIPGIRAESAGGEGNASYSIRGLPLAATGSKYMQLEEDGLPVLEFGDMSQFGSDMFMRSDLNISAIETIRGGSASTFASNSPGGVINLISKTGDVEGGTMGVTDGLTYGERRIDGDYGHALSDTLRFNIGGFYRDGEGVRNLGYDAYRGGQLKFNITKTFAGGYVRIYAKYLDDHTPSYQSVPMMVTGTDSNPTYSNLPGFDVKTDSMMSRNNFDMVQTEAGNQVASEDMRDGQHAIVKSIGLESQYDVSGWSISEKFRFSAVSGDDLQNLPVQIAPAAALAYAYGGPGGHLSYATGPLTGQVITNPATLNGNGLLSVSVNEDFQAHSLQNITNDVRVNRVWDVGGGELTATAGFYKSSQDYNTNWGLTTVLSDVLGGGNAALINVTTAGGIPTTQNGYLAYGVGEFHRQYDVTYSVNAPYGSLNYHYGKLAVGASVRDDIGGANGTLYGSDLGGGRVGVAPIDINGDGVISLPESQTDVLPLGQPGKVDYSYHYLSYSLSANYHIIEPLAVFGRYSVGGRAADDKILFTGAVNPVTGRLVNPASAYDPVKQGEVGLKFREAGFTFNATGFTATTGERNVQIASNPDGSILVQNIVRQYSAKGVEVEAGLHHGIFALTFGGTYTDAHIISAVGDPELVNNTPRHQAAFIYEATPQIETKYVTVGANIVGTTSSYAEDTDQLKLPAYTLVNAFAQFRPAPHVQAMVNVNNLFDTLAITEVTQSTIPVGGIVLGRAMAGRSVAATVNYNF